MEVLGLSGVPRSSPVSVQECALHTRVVTRKLGGKHVQTLSTRATYCYTLLLVIILQFSNFTKLEVEHKGLLTIFSSDVVDVVVQYGRQPAVHLVWSGHTFERMFLCSVPSQKSEFTLTKGMLSRLIKVT